MNVFVYEHLSGGGLAGRPLPPSLAAEGRQMWSAVVEDFSLLRDVAVTTSRDVRVPPLRLPGVVEREVATSTQAAAVFQHACQVADAICIIAPELEEELSRRIAVATGAARGKARMLNADESFCRLAGDKWNTWRVLADRQIPTIPTKIFSSGAQPGRWPAVLKPRHGAGSQDMALVRSPQELETACRRFSVNESSRQMILQPYLAGRNLSGMASFDCGGALIECYPVAEQQISIEGGFTYLGGRCPATNSPAPRHDLLLAVCRALSTESGGRIVGLVGVDFLEVDETGELLVVDVNPRLTTSYVGYRRLARHNLLAPLLDRPSAECGWRTGPVSWCVADSS